MSGWLLLKASTIAVCEGRAGPPGHGVCCSVTFSLRCFGAGSASGAPPQATAAAPVSAAPAARCRRRVKWGWNGRACMMLSPTFWVRSQGASAVYGQDRSGRVVAGGGEVHDGLRDVAGQTKTGQGGGLEVSLSELFESSAAGVPAGVVDEAGGDAVHPDGGRQGDGEHLGEVNDGGLGDAV